MLLFYYHCNRGASEKYRCHMLKYNRWCRPRTFSWGFSKPYAEGPPGWDRVSSRLPWLPACNKMHYFNISVHWLTLHWQDAWGTKMGLFHHHFAEAPEKEYNQSMRVSGHSLLTIKKWVFGPKRRKSRPSAMLTEDNKALLGSTARSWHAALWDRTDECPAQGQGSFFVLSHCLTPLPVQAKKCHQSLIASCFQKFFQTEGKSISHHYRELSPTQLFPPKESLSFLGGYMTLLKNHLKGKNRATVQRVTEVPALRKPISTTDCISWAHLWCWQAVLLIFKDTETKLPPAGESSQDSWGDKGKEEDSLVFLLCLPLDVEIQALSKPGKCPSFTFLVMDSSLFWGCRSLRELLVHLLLVTEFKFSKIPSMWIPQMQ